MMFRLRTMLKLNYFLVSLIILIKFKVNFALDNGLVNKAPLGWLAWAKYTCNTDCETYPDECISERLFYKQAELLAKGRLTF